MKNILQKIMRPKPILAFSVLMLVAFFGFNNVARVEADATTTATTTQGSVASTSPVIIKVMKHLCPASIKTQTDFVNVQNNWNSGSASTSSSTSESVGKFAWAEWNCPTSALPGDVAPANTISGARTNFNITVSDTNGHTKNLSQATYEPSTICESGLNMDLNMNGAISTSTCLDASHYVFTGLTGDMINVTESNASDGHHFGTVLFTPTQIMANNDAQSLVSITPNDSTGQGTVMLSTATDTDRVITLHVFNFTDMATSTGTSTPPVNSSPSITLTGANPLVVTQGQTFVDPGATASDPEQGNLTSSIVVTGGPVNVSTVGTTTLTYTVTDAGGLTKTVTRTVIVQASPINGGNNGGTGTTSTTTNNNGGGSGTTTPPFSTDVISAFVHVLDRVQDIQAGILNLLDKLLSR
jgi:hypothetical protein